VIFLFIYYNRAFRVAGFGFLAIAAISAALQPLTRFVPGKRWLAGGIVGLLPGLLLAATIVLGGWLLVEPVKREVGKWPQAQESLNKSLAKFSGRAGIEPPLTVQSVAGKFSPPSGGNPVAKVTSLVGDFLVAIVLVCFGTIFFLATPKGALLGPTLRLFPPHRHPQLRAAMDELYPQLRWWVIGAIVSMTSVAIASWVGFKLAGLQFHVPLAMLAGLSEIVPSVGPAVTFLIALAFAAAQGWQVVVYVALVWVVVQTLESYVITPLVMRTAVDIPPLISLLTILFWGHVFGVVGLLLAIPLNLLVWTLAKHFLMYPDAAEGDMPAREEGRRATT
jgi:predicted PurR-regulated permease PerM